VSGLALAAVPFLIGCVLGALTQLRIARLALPPLALALLYWVAVGWNGNVYDTGRSGLVVITGLFGATFVALWVAGCGIGRLLRREFAAK
jgi:hypothetical protein